MRRTALHVARGRDVTAALVAAGAPLDRADDNGDRAVDRARARGDEPAVAELVHAGADSWIPGGDELF
jgi:hypothetical protein